MLTIDQQNALADAREETYAAKRLRIAQAALDDETLAGALADYLNGDSAELDGLLREVGERLHVD